MVSVGGVLCWLRSVEVEGAVYQTTGCEQSRER